MPDKSIVLELYSSLPKGVRNIFNRFNAFHVLPLYLSKNSILWEKGWFRSRKEEAPVDANGNPTPWYTYSAIDFLDSRIDSTHRVFEYGGGYSTLWYAQRVESVVSVEDSEEWVEIITQRLPDNGKIIYQSSKKDYVEEVLEHRKYDIIIIDGSHRTDCIDPAIEALSDDGVVIWDDFEQLDKTDYQVFTQRGFSTLPLWGLNSSGLDYKSTSIFYRDENCLGI